MRHLLLSAAAGMVLLAAQNAQADFIVAIGAGAGTDAIGIPPTVASNGQLTSRDFTSPAPIVPPSAFPPGTQVNNDDYSGAGAANPNQATFSLSVFNWNAPIDVSVTVQPATSVPPGGDLIGAAEYYFAVTVTNLLGANGNPLANPVIGREIQGITVELVPGTTGASFDSPRDPAYAVTGPAFPLQPNFPATFPASNTIRFGGLNGGGGGLAPGASNTFYFSIDIPGSSSISPPRVFTLRFTANPEPGSLMLALAAVGGFGGVNFLRRRKTQAPEAVEDVVA